MLIDEISLIGLWVLGVVIGWILKDRYEHYRMIDALYGECDDCKEQLFYKALRWFFNLCKSKNPFSK